MQPKRVAPLRLLFCKPIEITNIQRYKILEPNREEGR